MKKNTIIAGILLTTLGMVSCNSGKEEKVNEQLSEQITENKPDTTSME